MADPLDVILRSIKQKEACLNIGCQDSGKGARLSKEGFSVTFLDINKQEPTSIKTKFNLSNAKFIQQDIREFETDEKFDVILLNRMIQIFSHKDQEKVINLLKNLINSGGCIHMTWPNLDNFPTINKAKKMFSSNFRTIFQKTFLKKDSENHEHIIRSIVLKKFNSV